MINYAKPSDKGELIKLFNSVFGEDGEQLASDYIDCCFSNDYHKPLFVVKRENDKIVGAAAYSQELFTTDTWGISWVAVYDEHQHCGYGSELVKFCLSEIKDKIDNYAFVILGTFPEKTGLYDRLNFEKIYNDNEHGSLMIKKIAKEKA